MDVNITRPAVSVALTAPLVKPTISQRAGASLTVNRTGYLQPRRLNLTVPIVGAPGSSEVFGTFTAADSATLVLADCAGGASTLSTSSYVVTIRKLSDSTTVATATFSAGVATPVFASVQSMVKGQRYQISGSAADATLKDFDVNFVWLVG